MRINSPSTQEDEEGELKRRTQIMYIMQAVGKAGNVISMQHLGLAAQDLSLLSTHNLLMHALSNLSSEGGHTVQPSAQYAPDLRIEQHHYFSVAFPQLFPYGTGAPGGQQHRKLSFIQHIRWLLHYHDRQFCLDHSFPFVAFGIYQKQQCLTSAHLHMTRKDFEGDCEDLSKISISELMQAAEEDMHKTPIMNPKIHKLLKHLKITAG